MCESQYKYDVAFSFLARDERLAERLGELLDERYDVFVYSQRQKELAGTDGLEKFSAVFRSESRVCVVLHREGWGETKWTRIEETAIKNRGFDSGWDFLLVVALDDSVKPEWLPRTRLWLGFERYGITAVVGAIDAKIHEAGGLAKEETAAEKAERLRREAEWDRKRREVLHSAKGVDLATAELDRLADHLEKEVQVIASSGTPLEFLRPRRRVIVVRSPRCSVTFGWSQQWANSLEYSGLIVRELNGAYHPDGWGEGPSETNRASFDFDLDSAGNPIWRNEQTGQEYSTDRLAEAYLSRVVEGAYSSPD